MKFKRLMPAIVVILILFLCIGGVLNYISTKNNKATAVFDVDSISSMIIQEDMSEYFGELKGCFVLYDRNKQEYNIYNQEKAQARMLPDSPLNIAGLSLGDEINSTGISPIEQVELLRSLYDGELDPDRREAVLDGIFAEKVNEGRLSEVSYKDKAGKLIYAGLYEKRGNALIFAVAIEGNSDLEALKQIASKVLADKDKAARKALLNRVLYEVPNMKDVNVEKDLVYKALDAGELKFDVYHSLKKDSDGRGYPLILVHGRADSNRLKDMPLYQSWGRLAAASGYTAIIFNWRSYDRKTYRAHEEDIYDLIKYVQENADVLSVNSNHMAVIGYSAGADSAVNQAIKSNTGFIDSIIAYYGTPASTILEIENPSALPPIMMVDGAQDATFPIAKNIEFVKDAMDKGYNITHLIHSKGLHAFDMVNDTEETYEIIKNTFKFVEASRRDK